MGDQTDQTDLTERYDHPSTPMSTAHGPNAPGQEPKSPMKEAVCQGVDFQPGDGVNRVAATSLTMWCH